MFKLVSLYDQYTKELMGTAVVRIEDNAWIPKDPDNTDYQQYLAWLEAGNKPLPADK